VCIFFYQSTDDYMTEQTIRAAEHFKCIPMCQVINPLVSELNCWCDVRQAEIKIGAAKNTPQQDISYAHRSVF